MSNISDPEIEKELMNGRLMSLIQDAFDYGTGSVFEALAQTCEAYAEQQAGYPRNAKAWRQLAVNTRKSLTKFYATAGQSVSRQ